MKIIVILGPTSSGKSDLAVKLAQKFNGEIVSADSRQVYRELDIGSGKITKKEMKGVKHYLLDVADPKKNFTVVQYQKLAKEAVKKIVKNGKLPIICGGTGFYIDSLIYDYKFPETKPRLKLRKELDKKEIKELLKILEKINPKFYKKIDKNNKRRIIRAIELTKEIGDIPKIIKNYPYQYLKIGIKKDSGTLKKLIYKRLKKRIKAGMLNEVKKLIKKGVSHKRLEDLGMEYRYVSRYLRGLINKQEMIDLINREHRRYSKRQMTWFKKDKEINWITREKEAYDLIKNFMSPRP